jgi:hypothetical protein
MPISCSSSSLTGQEGAIYFQPAGTQFCLNDWSDFPAGTAITVPSDHDYAVGDPVIFTEEGTGVLDSALSAGATYVVVAKTATTITVAADGDLTYAPIVLKGDGGTGTADTPGVKHHVKIDYAEFGGVCQVKNFSLELTREELDVTVLPCGLDSGGGKYAQFRRTQAGYASGTGSMSVLFTNDQTSLANRLLANVMLRSQQGAEVKLYVNHVANSTGTAPDDSQSIYVQAPISITSMSLNVSPDEATTAELSYSISGQPTSLLGIEL